MGSFDIVISPAAPVIRVSIPFSTKLVFSLSHIPPISPAIAFFMTSTAVDKSSIHGSPPIAVAIPSPSFRKFSTVAIPRKASTNPVMNALRNSPSEFQSKLPKAVPIKFPMSLPRSPHGISAARSARAFISLLRNVVSFNAFVVHSKSRINVEIPLTIFLTRPPQLKFTANAARESNAPFSAVARACAMSIKDISENTLFRPSATDRPIFAKLRSSTKPAKISHEIMK